jgi:Tfp pilus assembly protein PilN
VVLLGVAGMFGWQQWRLNKLEAQWKGMEARVNVIKDTEARIRKYRPWYDESFRALSILKAITSAFPEDGTVAAKSVEIRDRSGITCSGTARNNAALLRMLDQLRASKQVKDVKVEHVKGGQNNQPLEFTFNFHWADAQASR